MLIAVLIANALAALLQPSCYDSIIMIKKLPYLPDILPSSSNAYKVYVEDFMLREVSLMKHLAKIFQDFYWISYERVLIHNPCCLIKNKA